MLKKTIKYTDYNGIEREEDFYFNISKAELTEKEWSIEGGLSEMLTSIVKANNAPAIMKIFKELILESYGEKSQDGRRFIKSKEISSGFEQTEAFSILFMELLSDTDTAVNFVKGILPPDMVKEIDIEEAKKTVKKQIKQAD